MTRIISFAYKHGPRPAADIAAFNVTDLPNPHGLPALRGLTGRDGAVQEFLLKHQRCREHLDQAELVLLRRGIVAFGCYGGRHRSVALAELLAQRMKSTARNCIVEHWSLPN